MKKIFNFVVIAIFVLALISCKESKEDITLSIGAIGVSPNQVGVWTNTLGITDYRINSDNTITISVSNSEKESIKQELIRQADLTIERNLVTPLLSKEFDNFTYNDDFTVTKAYFYGNEVDDNFVDLTGYGFAFAAIPYQALNGVPVEDIKYTHIYVNPVTDEELFSKEFTYDMVNEYDFSVFDIQN